MVIKKKISEKEREKFIDKGAPVKSKDKKSMLVHIKMPVELVKKIDELVDDSFISNRSAWIIQALQKAVEKEKK